MFRNFLIDSIHLLSLVLYFQVEVNYLVAAGIEVLDTRESVETAGEDSLK
jgi:hypothetical protein